jgi:hypothetical protein
MKKVIGGAVVALSLITLAACTEEAKAEGNALTVNPFVGAEHAMDANTNTGTVGADIVSGDLTVTASADLSLNADANGDRFGTELVEIDFSYAVSDKTSIYMENDLNDSFVKSETIVGVKHYF